MRLEASLPSLFSSCPCSLHLDYCPSSSASACLQSLGSKSHGLTLLVHSLIFEIVRDLFAGPIFCYRTYITPHLKYSSLAFPSKFDRLALLTDSLYLDPFRYCSPTLRSAVALCQLEEDLNVETPQLHPLTRSICDSRGISNTPNILSL